MANNTDWLPDFKNSVLPTIVGMTDLTDPANKERLAVCRGSVILCSALAGYLKNAADDDIYRPLFQRVYNFMPLVCYYSAIGMLAPKWFTFSRFWILCALIWFFKLGMTM